MKSQSRSAGCSPITSARCDTAGSVTGAGLRIIPRRSMDEYSLVHGIEHTGKNTGV